MVCLTNDDYNTQTRQITYHPYKAGQKLCNLLFSGDCINVSSDNKVTVTLLHGEAKILVPSANEGELQESLLQ